VRIPKPKSKLGVAVAGVCGIVLIGAASAGYYKVRGEKVCEGCHEVRPSVDSWRSSTHRSVGCTGCHDDAVTLDPSTQIDLLGTALTHLRGAVPERILLAGAALDRVVGRCGSCHRTEHAGWQAGPHGKAFATFFLNEVRNRDELLIDDCLRCHGAHFQGGIGDLVQPLDTKGPWRLVRPEMAGRPAMPCTACHRIHGPEEVAGAGTGVAAAGTPSALPTAAPPAGSTPAAAPAPPVPTASSRPAAPDFGSAAREAVHKPSLAFFDRRGLRHVPVGDLRIPEMREGARAVLLSPDRRQALCYQCHGPDETRQVRSGTDRTPTGVHEGLSCLACHRVHGMTTRTSCASCHPRLSNCGLDVEAMDTTFLAKSSKHDIHTVKCADCHPGGVPERKKKA